MGGISSNDRTIFDLPKERQPDKIFSVGMYARISVDAGERKRESVETQIEIIKEFIQAQRDMKIYGSYIDIGKTGTSFERDGFERMMRDVARHKIDCIIVKDLSRFGRNHIETGNFIEKIFPFLGVRFIAVTDHFDSMNSSGQDESLCVNLKNLVNEMYARDISVKVKSAKKAKWEQGGYTGGIPPYGYRAEWRDGRKCLYVEEGTADIVKQIFALFLSGSSIRMIVEWLYANQVARPAGYHKTGQVYCSREQNEQWPRASVKMILTNPVYMGCLVRGRAGGKDYMMRGRHDIDSEDWSVKEHTHEALISEEQFFEAAAKFKKSAVYCNKSKFSKSISPEEDPFANILYCGECGRRMRRISSAKVLDSHDKARIYNYHCPGAGRIDKFKCGAKNISLYSLLDLIRAAVRLEFYYSTVRPAELASYISWEAETRKEKWNLQCEALERKLEGITRLGSEQYLKFRMGGMEEKRFLQAREENRKKAASIQREREAITDIIREIDGQTAGRNQFLSGNIKEGEKSGATAEIVQALIHRIEVYADRRVKVIFAFKGNKF